jgi:hypothetical protein
MEPNAKPIRVRRHRISKQGIKKELEKEAVKEVKQVIRDQKAQVRTPRRGQKRAVRSFVKSAKVEKLNKIAISAGAYVVAPKTQLPVRWGSSYNDNKTAVSTPWSLPTVGWSADATFSGQLPASRMLAAIFREPARAIIAYEANFSEQLWTYNFSGGDVGSASLAAYLKGKAHNLLDFFPIMKAINDFLGPNVLMEAESEDPDEILGIGIRIQPIKIKENLRAQGLSESFQWQGKKLQFPILYSDLVKYLEKYTKKEFHKGLHTAVKRSVHATKRLGLSPLFNVAVPDNTTVDLFLPYATAFGTFQPHGSVLFAGTISSKQDQRFFWIDKGATVSFTGDAVTATTSSLELIGNFWSSDGYVQEFVGNSQTVTGSETVQFDIAINTSGYYSFSFSTDNATTIDITDSGFFSEADCFGHHCIPGLESNGYAAEAIRMTAATMMYTNVASMLNLEGKVAMVQFSAGKNWMDLIASQTAITGAADVVNMSAKEGMYGFLKPTQPDDFNFITNLNYDAVGNLTDSFYSIDSPGAFVACDVNITVPDGQDAYWTFTFGIEYITQDVWRPTGRAKGKEADFTEALEFVKKHPQFCQNANHLTSLFNGLKTFFRGASNGIMKYGPGVLDLAKKASEVLA